jgi:hypothetical protein
MNEILQPLFDKAVKAVIAQGSCSLCADENTCAYRGVDNKKCAIGHLLSDEQIASHGIKEGMLPNKFPPALIQELLPGVQSGIAVQFLEELQNCHDTTTGSNFVKTFTRVANEMASKWDLKKV